MKVFDCFTFYNEFELLELRLKSLWDVVDYFVLVESDKTFTNKPKPFYFDERKNDFTEFLPKIRNIKIKMNIPYKGTGDWSIEFAQRNMIAQDLQDAAPDDLIFISDLDEIWAPDILQRINNRQTPVFAKYLLPAPPRFGGQRLSVPCQLMVHAADLLEVSPISMQQTFHYYYFDFASKKPWSGTVLTKRKNLTAPQHLRNLRGAFPSLPDGGHHFSYFGGVDRIISKITSIVDGNAFVEQSDGKFIERQHLETVMKTGRTMYGPTDNPEQEFLPYDISNIKLPHFAEFVKKYPNFLRPKD